jgi:hypothetical protein
MKRVALALAALTMATFAGCWTANDKEADRLTDEMVGALKELLAALESVQDAETAKAAAVRINAVCDRLEKVAQEGKDLTISKSKEKELEDRINQELKSLESRMEQAGMQAALKCGDEPTFMAAIQRLQVVGQAMQSMSR